MPISTLTFSPPSNRPAEIALCGSLLLGPSYIPEVNPIITPDDFYSIDVKALYKTIINQYLHHGNAIDAVLILAGYKFTTEEERAVTVNLIAECLESVPTAANAIQYAKTVRNFARQRAVLAITQQITSKTEKGIPINGELENLVTAVAQLDLLDHEEISPDLIGQEAAEIFKNIKDEVDYILYPVLIEGCLTQLQGDPKAGKSCLAVLIALACSVGRWMSQRWEYEAKGPIRVGYISYEDNLRRLKRRCKEYMPGLGIKEFPTNLILWGKSPDLDLSTKEGARRLKKLIEYNKLDLIIIDTFSFIHTAEENSKKEMGPVMMALRRLLEDFPKLAILMIHHTNKAASGGDQSSIAKKGRGSSSIAAAPDVILDFGNRVHTNTTACAMASKEKPSWDEFHVLYKPQEDGTVLWELVDAQDVGPKADAKAGLIEAIRLLCEVSPEGVDRATIEGASKISKRTLQRYLNEFVKDRTLVVVEELSGRRLYKLTSPSK